MAKEKKEVFLEKEHIEFLETISENRSEAIRICVENEMKRRGVKK